MTGPPLTAEPGGPEPGDPTPPAGDRSLATVAREWTRIGITGFGGPPAHIALLRQLVVGRMKWMDAREFEDANAACGLLPGPASTQLSIFCAYRVAGPAGAIVGGLGFIVPAVVLILALSLLFLAHAPPLWVRGAGAGAGTAVAAVAVQAARGLIGPSRARARDDRRRSGRWLAYLAVGTAAAALIGPYLVLALLACGAAELLVQQRPWPSAGRHHASFGMLLPASISTGGIGALAWTAFKVGALSFGGGFVIIPLMQADAVHTYHWMSNSQFLNAVALGQITPGPVVATVAAVGYAAHGIAGGVLAALVAFAPSFSFILLGGGRFERLRGNANARAFLDGAGPAAIGAILGAAILLAAALHETWQFAILAAAAIALLALRRGIVQTLLGAALVGVIAALAGAPLP
ncbi:MAG TPA: chromate efflux transporter [Solirubrobacteraceae bacterium]|nr:chromate efflux transporter [Solirubrobacteraceae bacterium]